MDACAELGVKNLTLCGDAPNKEKFARVLQDMADYAAPRGFNIDVEFMIWRTVGTLEQAYELVKMADRPNCTIAVDSLHLYRSGGSHNDLDKIPQKYLGEIHLCDAVINGPIDPKLVQAQRAGTLKVESTAGTPKGFEALLKKPARAVLSRVSANCLWSTSCAICLKDPSVWKYRFPAIRPRESLS